MLTKALLLALLPTVGFAIVPRPASDVLIPAIAGPKINLRLMKGKVVALAIVSTACKDCAATAQVLDRVQKDLGPRGFQSIVVVGDNESQATAAPFAQRYHLRMPIGYLTKDDIIRVANITTEKPVAPILMFIDKQGVVRAQYYGDNDFFKSTEARTRAEVEGLLKGK